ncbi:polysaccharide deacetylase family protein, partial [candidate division GN15 bacterium]|nr:polysaccharide deacetylase family protein [candidate division GN15 bacterium]
MSADQHLVTHAISVDVEDWNNAAVLWVAGRIVPPTEAVVRNTERLLDLFG